MASFLLECVECGTTYQEDAERLVCDSCSKQQEPGGVTRGVLSVEIEELPTAWPGDSPDSSAFLETFWPLSHQPELAPISVGNTPLLPVGRLREQLGMPNLWVKDDSRNPSGSTKDRASLLVLAKAREYRRDTVAAASTGNAASAMAALAASQGLRAVAFVPASAPQGKLVQLLHYGADVIPIDGSYDDAFETCLKACREFGWYNRNTALNPFTAEGKKTAALEMVLQLGGEPPDVVLVPTGDGVIISGVAKGFADLERSGLTDRRPRLMAVQPTGSAAIAQALRSGADRVMPISDAASIADSLVVGAPRNAIQCLREVSASGGTGVIVSDREITGAQSELARLTGVFAEPAAAAALAGLHTALREELVDRDERVVLLVTGNGLKDVPAAARGVRLPAPVPADLDAVYERMAAKDV